MAWDDREKAAADNGLLTARWHMGDGLMLGLVANLSDQAIAQDASPTGTIIWGTAAGSSIAPWSVCWRLETR